MRTLRTAVSLCLWAVSCAFGWLGARVAPPLREEPAPLDGDAYRAPLTYEEAAELNRLLGARAMFGYPEEDVRA